ncbi:MAG TPA: prephenate dehydrogenase [Nocardioidaceae bacterium]|nr:prephenate dehydrogenase [Nocardioidaceae bacterium]
MGVHRNALTGPVRVVGTGLLGTSIGLALRQEGIDVQLSDVHDENVRIASGLGAGSPARDVPAQLVVVAVPPDQVAAEIEAALVASDGIVTDVGSVKSLPLRQVGERVSKAQLERYVGGHPMAGSERSGPLAASAALFDGRPWALTPHPHSAPAAIDLVTELARLCGALPVTFTPDEHDRAVARTSHLPHLLAALVAGRLTDAPADHMVLSGQGVRDVTRIAAGDPGLWQQIITANAVALTDLLREVRDDLDLLLSAVHRGERSAIVGFLDRGVAGTVAIPGKHGGPAQAISALFVAVPDHPGELARLLADAGDIGVNVEDLRIDHDPGRPVGLVELTVASERVDFLQESLEARSWTTHR